MTLSFEDLLQALSDTPLAHWQSDLQAILHARLNNHNNGNLPKFLAAFEAMPPAPDGLDVDLTDDVIKATSGRLKTPLPESQRAALQSGLRGLMPWRKGPFHLLDSHIDSEWQCQFKWQRVAPYLSDLHGRTVLDVGSGNGYFGWRMLGAGAERVIGVDPSWLSVVQHLAVNQYVQHPRHHVLPLTLEDISPGPEAFDTVFSMGVLYHRRSPLDHLDELRLTLRPGGELVLETLVTEGPKGYALVPEARYARMNNVWFLPSVPTLVNWCEKMGFESVRCVDEAATLPEEQRVTDWKPGQSLQDYLAPSDPSRTIEGHPAPRRAIIIARRPEAGRLRRYRL